MTDQEIAASRELDWKNECPDVRPRLVAAGRAPEKQYKWMVSNEISTKRDGDCNVLVVAPHGFLGNDDNTEILTCFLAEELKSYAVINNRKYNRDADPAKYEFCQDLNKKEEAPACKDFWDPLMECTKLILQTYAKPPLILIIHGLGDKNAYEKLGADGAFILGAGYEGAYNPDTATASEGLVTKLRDALRKKFGPAQDGVKNYGAKGRVPVLFRELFPNEKIEAIQLEVRCRGYRDSIENIEKLVKGLMEIFTDTSEQGFQDYFTRERKVMDGITIDEEFKSFVPPLSEEEYQRLEENILAAGACHDPMRVWPHEGKRILLDGHHRREICLKRGLPNPAIVEVELGSREEAIQWIAEHQLGRRNLKPFQRIELAYRMEPAIRELAKARQKDAHKLRGKGAEAKDEASLHSDEILGKIAGVGGRTYRKGRDVIERGTEDLVQKCRDGEIAIDAAFKQIDKPRKEMTSKKAAAHPQSAAQGAPNITPDPVPEPVIEPSQLTAAQPVPQPDELISVPDLPPPSDVIIVNVPWELPSLNVEKLAALPVDRLAQEDCMVWLRATNSRIPEAYSLLNGWGFEPKTLFTWIKQEAEPAEWLDDRSEHYVVGIRGNPPVDAERKFSTSLNTAEAPDNVGKPMRFYQQLELYCAGDRRLQVFPEAPRDEWISWNPPWHVDTGGDRMMPEEPPTARDHEGSGKKTEKPSKKGRKRQTASPKEEEVSNESE